MTKKNINKNIILKFSTTRRKHYHNSSKKQSWIFKIYNNNNSKNHQNNRYCCGYYKHIFKQILKSKKFSNILNNICPPSKVMLGNKLNANKHKLTTAPTRKLKLQHTKNNIKFPKQPEINTIMSCRKFNSFAFINFIPLSSKQTHLGFAEKTYKKII